MACLPRDTNPSPIYRRRAVVETSSLGLHSLVAERRHSSVTRYAKRSVACRDSPRHQPLRAGGTPLPRHRRLPSAIVHHHHRIAHPHRPPSIYMRFGDALLRRPRKRSRLQLTPDSVGGCSYRLYALRSITAEAQAITSLSPAAPRRGADRYFIQAPDAVRN